MGRGDAGRSARWWWWRRRWWWGTHLEAPEARVAACAEADDLDGGVGGGGADPAVDEGIDGAGAEVGADVDERGTWGLEMGAGDERGDVGVVEVALADGGEACEGGVGVCGANGSVGVGRREHGNTAVDGSGRGNRGARWVGVPGVRGRGDRGHGT